MCNKTGLTIDFVSEVNALIKERKLDGFIFTGNPNEIIPLIELYNACKFPVLFGGASALIEGVLDNFRQANFGIDYDIDKLEETVDIAKSDISESFFKMQSVVMLIINVFESVKHIISIQDRIKAHL